MPGIPSEASNLANVRGCWICTLPSCVTSLFRWRESAVAVLLSRSPSFFNPTHIDQSRQNVAYFTPRMGRFNRLQRRPFPKDTFLSLRSYHSLVFVLPMAYRVHSMGWPRHEFSAIFVTKQHNWWARQDSVQSRIRAFSVSGHVKPNTNPMLSGWTHFDV